MVACLPRRPAANSACLPWRPACHGLLPCNMAAFNPAMVACLL
jgi:hypothetical protein